VTGNELHLCCAIRLAKLGGRDRPTTSQRMNAALAVMTEWLTLTGDSFFPFTIDDIERLSILLRKNSDAKIKVDIALKHGAECYFKSRGKGPCSEDIEAGHIVQRSTGGPLNVENGQIECRSHNNQRRAMSIEDYMKSSATTEQHSHGT